MLHWLCPSPLSYLYEKFPEKKLCKKRGKRRQAETSTLVYGVITGLIIMAIDEVMHKVRELKEKRSCIKM